MNAQASANKSDNQALHVVLGATGGAGSAIMRELARQGKRVRAVNRSGKGEMPAGVELVKGDITRADDAKRVCEGATVVYNAANVFYSEWLTTFPAIVEGSIAGAAAANAKLVFVDNLYMYGKVNGPITETTPYNPAGKKGALRAQLANRLMDAHKSGTVQVSIGRGSDYYGENANSAAGDFLMAPILEGKKSSWVGSLDAPHTMTYLDDLARGIAILGERDEANGQIFHIPSGDPITGRQFLTTAFRIAGYEPKIGSLNKMMMTLVSPFMVIARESLETMYQFENPFVMDTTKFTRTFGPMKTTQLEDGLRSLIAWYRERQAQGVVAAAHGA